MVTSLILIIIISLLKTYKLKTHQKMNRKIQNQQNYQLQEMQKFIKNFQSIFLKTTIINYFSLKKINNLLAYETKTNQEKFSFLERSIFYLYYLVLAFLMQ
jgi:hypothetical protein